MAPSPGRNNVAIFLCVLSASGGAYFAYYIYKRVRELRSHLFGKRIARAITNGQLAVLAKSPNVSLRQSAEQMLLDRILEREAFQEVIRGCQSKDENELFRACSVFCVVLKSVNFTVPLSLAEIVKLLTLCLQKSLDREKYFTSRSSDSIFDIKIQRMTLATVCDFLSDSVTKKDVLVRTCPEMIQVCLQLIRESKNKEVLRYSVLLLFQISGLGTTSEVRESGAIAVLADRIITFHGDNIMQRITIQTIVILIGSVDDSKTLCEEIAKSSVLMPTTSSFVSDDVELSFWSLALIQEFVNNDLCTDELTSMSYLVKNFVTILKTREGTFKSFVMKILGTLCERREKFLKEIVNNKVLLKAVAAALKDKNNLVVNYCLRFLKVLLQGGSTVMEKVLDVPENAILKGLQHIATENSLDNKLLMTELLAEFIQTEKFVLRIVQNGGLEIVKALATDKGEADMGFFSSAMLIDMAMISDEVKMELAKMCILPILINWVTLPNKNDKVAVFAAKTLVMLHLIDGSVEVGAQSDGKSFNITVGDVRLEEPLNTPIKLFHWNSLFSQEILPLTLEEGSVTATDGSVTVTEGSLTVTEGSATATEGSVTATEGSVTATEGSVTATEGSVTTTGEHFEFHVPVLDSLKMENAGEFVFICLKGKEGSRYFKGLQKYVKMKSDDEGNSDLQISDTDVCVIIATVDEDGTLRSIQQEVGSPGAKVTSSIPYKFLVQQRTISLILPSILEPLALEDWQVGCPLKKKDLEVLNVFLCMEDYLNLLIYSNTTTANLLTTLRVFTGDSESEIKVHQAVIDILVTTSTYDSGRKHLLSLGTAQLLTKFITSLLYGYLQSTEPLSSPKSEVFDSDLVPIPPSVAAIISSLPPRPESRAEPRPVRRSSSSETTTDSRNQISSSSSGSGLLPVIPEDGFIQPEQGVVEPVRLSVSSLMEEVWELNKDEKKKTDDKKETEVVTPTQEPDTAAILQTALLCLAKLLTGNGESGGNDEPSLVPADELRKSGAVLSLWAQLLVANERPKKDIQLAIATSMNILCKTISVAERDTEMRVRFDRNNMTRTMLLSTDDLEVQNYNWTFESVRTNISTPPSPSVSPDQPGGWCYQMELLTDGLIQVGWCNDKCQYSPRKGIGVGDDYHSFSFDGVRCKKWRGPVAEQTQDNSYGEVWKTGDIVTCLLDHYGNISYLINEKNLGVAFPAIDLSVVWYPACSVCTYQWVRFNFGDEPFRFAESIPAGFVPLSESNQPQSPVPQKNDQESKSTEEAETITSSEQSTEEEKDDEEKHGEAGPAGADISLSRDVEGTDMTTSDEGARAAPGVGTPSLYFEVKVNQKVPRPLYIGFSTLDSSDQVALIIEEHHLVLPDLSVKPVPKEKVFVVGCGYVSTTHHVYFTLDGEPIELFFDFANPAASVRPVMPCLSSCSINVNWGQKTFEYKMTKSEKYSAVSTCQKFLQLCQEINKEDLPSEKQNDLTAQAETF